MKTTADFAKRALAAALVAGAGLCLSLVFAPPAAAWVDSGWGYYDSGYDWNYDESQAWAEESAREAGREKRREEIAKEQAQKAAEHEAYYAEVVNASKASLNAPKGVFYRKPGWISSDAPSPTAQSLLVGDVPLIYDAGIFWFARGADYIVVIPPFGAVVDKLPPGVRAQPAKDGGMLYYFFGTFYKAKGDKFEVVKPPAGTYVGYLPDGYTVEGGKDAQTFTFGKVQFKQVFLAGALAYQVI